MYPSLSCDLYYIVIMLVQVYFAMFECPLVPFLAQKYKWKEMTIAGVYSLMWTGVGG